MGLLDEVIRNTSTGPRIVSEQHDVSRIDFVAGLSDPGEMIRCGYRQDLRRQDGEQDEEYAARIRPLIMAMPKHERDVIMGAAVKRAGLDTSTGKVAVMVAGAAPWHRLGVNVESAVTSADARRLASLDWRVEKIQLSYGFGDEVLPADSWGLIREDTGAYLGTVGSRYKVIQNDDGFDFLDQVLADHGARFVTAGAVHGGAKVWMQVDLPQQRFEVVPGDEVAAYAIFTNPHDGSGKAYCYPTSERVVCNNTLRVSGAKDQSKGIGIRHTGDVKLRIADARQALGLAVREFDQFRESAEVLARTPIHAERFFSDILDAALEVTAAEAMMGADVLAATLRVTEAERELKQKVLARAITARQAVLDDILARYDSEKCGVGGIRGSAWSALNAVTEHADHFQPSRKVGTQHAQESRLFESILAGDRDELKQIAYQTALNLAG